MYIYIGFSTPNFNLMCFNPFFLLSNVTQCVPWQRHGCFWTAVFFYYDLQSDQSIRRVGEVFYVVSRNVETFAHISVVGISEGHSPIALCYTSLFICRTCHSSLSLSLCFLTFVNHLATTLQAHCDPTTYCCSLSHSFFEDNGTYLLFTTWWHILWISKCGSSLWFHQKASVGLQMMGNAAGIMHSYFCHHLVFIFSFHSFLLFS